MKARYLIPLLATLPFMTAAGIPNFFSGLIGKNVQKYCEMSGNEKDEMIQSVNTHTGSHKVVVVCSEKVAEAPATPANTRSSRIAR